jgi:hypothetical protein
MTIRPRRLARRRRERPFAAGGVRLAVFAGIAALLSISLDRAASHLG